VEIRWEGQQPSPSAGSPPELPPDQHDLIVVTAMVSHIVVLGLFSSGYWDSVM